MAFDKAIKYGKEWRKPYPKVAQQVDPSCRCHGGCEWCLGNRMYQYNKEKERTKQRMEEDLC